MMTMANRNAPLLEARGIGKSFGPVTALSDVSLSAAQGEIIGLVGVNGAGKSTLMNIFDGVLQPSEGEILLNGQPLRIDNPETARRQGIGFIHQHSTGFAHLSVADNVLIADDNPGFYSRAAARRLTAELLARLGADRIDPERRLIHLKAGERQMVDVARVLSDDPRLILFDEPTSSLSRQEAERLFDVIRTLRAEGRTIIYTSHFLDDVLALADRVVVLRDGRKVLDAPTTELTRESLVTAMLSQALVDDVNARRATASAGPVVMRVRDLRPRNRAAVSFDMHRGEVLGIWGLLGAGRTEILRALLGLDPADIGAIELADREGRLRPARPLDVRRRTGYVTEERHHDGLFADQPVWKNMTAASTRIFSGFAGRMDERRERAASETKVRELSVRLGTLDDPISSLSGGNQQKAIMARWLIKAPDLYVFDEPTHGVDVGAKSQIRNVIHAVVDKGASALVVSSEVEEIFALCDRILVLRDGEFVDELHSDAFDQARLLAAS